MGLWIFSISSSMAQNTSNHANKFEDLGMLLPSPNEYRGADGAPGPRYWQQRADYDIICSLDEDSLRLSGEESITYYNQSPQTLKYIWLQLDENQHDQKSDNNYFDPSEINTYMGEDNLRSLEPWQELAEHGCRIISIKDGLGKNLPYTINKTMLRVDLPVPLKPGTTFIFKVKWYYNLIDRINSMALARGGYEFFPEDGNHIFTITQWFPRMCVYSDFEGWQNKQFTGRGEFALNFGNYRVKMTVPADHIVGATGQCQNYATVLSPVQLQRWTKAQTAKEPVEIVTLEEAKNAETNKSKAKKTWIYKADNVRDFAWTSSRKFAWDAMPAQVKGAAGKTMCMSYYGKEAYPIYRPYSTKAVAHTIHTYSNYSIPYPYPVAISVEAANGMEYPMICFNPGRAEKDGTYSERAKNAALTVIFHEVGHNFFPMIINSDERQWSWFDEGLNTFMQFITEQEWDNNYDSGEGPPHQIVDYMSLPKDQLEPIMTASDNIVDFFANAYRKPATALNILRETIMGRELFDFSFREYCRRWAFKHPTPADFFRTMEDASGMDLDWFWRGWFFGIESVDISIDSIRWFKVDLENNPVSFIDTFVIKENKPYDHLTKVRYRQNNTAFPVEKDSTLQDFYTFYQPWTTEDSIQYYKTIVFGEQYSNQEKIEKYGDKNYYQLFFSNKGGLVMPLILEWTFKDGTTETETIPVEVWRKNENAFSKVFIKNKEVTGIKLDPNKETADVNESNNNWPVKEFPSRFQVFKKHKEGDNQNLMQKAQNKVIKP